MMATVSPSPVHSRSPHWYGGEDQLQDGLSFAMAPYTLKEGKHVYPFELLKGGRFAEHQQCGVLKISGHCTLFATLFKVKTSSLYYASLWTHQVGGAVTVDNEMHSKVVITYADLVWIEVGSSDQYAIEVSSTYVCILYILLYYCIMLLCMLWE